MENLARKKEDDSEARKKLEFVKCPCCDTSDLIEFGVEAICCHCDWNSAEMFMSEGLIDNRFLAFKEQFDPQNKIVRKYNQRILRLKNHSGCAATSRTTDPVKQ